MSFFKRMFGGGSNPKPATSVAPRQSSQSPKATTASPAAAIQIDYFLATAGCGDEDGIEKQLDKGASVNAKNVHGLTALMMASQNGHIEVVRLLLNKGADVNAKDKDGDTALKLATQYGPHPEVQALLVQAGARQ